VLVELRQQLLLRGRADGCRHGPPEPDHRVHGHLRPVGCARPDRHRVQARPEAGHHRHLQQGRQLLGPAGEQVAVASEHLGGPVALEHDDPAVKAPVGVQADPHRGDDA
jgi:hypothetical protein